MRNYVYIFAYMTIFIIGQDLEIWISWEIRQVEFLAAGEASVKRLYSDLLQGILLFLFL